MKKRGLSVLLAVALTVTSVFSGMSLSVKANELQKAIDTPKYRNVVYYGEWSIYAGQKYFNPSDIDGSNITHLNFAFLDMDANGELVLCDEHADFLAVLPEQQGITYGEPYAGVLGAMSILRSKYPNMKIGISVGGWTRSGDFSAVAANPAKRANFAKNISKFVDYLGYDFVDIDWEYPTAVRESDPTGNGVSIDEGCPGTEADSKNFILLMQAIRDELDKLGKNNNKYYELSTAMSASPTMMEKIEYDKLLDIVDFVNMMTYDLNGAWSDYTAHHTALYTNPAYDKTTQTGGQLSVDTCIQFLKDNYKDSIDYSKIVIGVAPYTRGWAGVEKDGKDSKNPGLYATAKPNSVKSADGTTSGTFAYSDIDTLITQYGLKEYYDETAQAAYYYSADTGYFFSCDNERSVAAKGEYVRENNLGGLISWMASLDRENHISKTMKESLYGNVDLPVYDIVTANINVAVDIAAEGSVYTITIKNNEKTIETNTALRDAELFKKTIVFPKLYIKSKSGMTFSAGSQSGAVTNENGYGVIDLSSVYAAKSMKPGTSHTFTVRVSGNADVKDIEGITMTQRITTSLKEFGAQSVWGKNVSPSIPETETESETETKSEIETESETEEEKEEDKENNYYVNGKLPQHMVTGYWHNFCNGSKNLKLSDVPTYYDMICVAFTGNTSVPGEVTFELDEYLCRQLGGYTKAEFIKDIKDLKARGQHVIISVGGAEGRIEINSNAAANLFAEGLIDIIEEYGFEGVDIDLEGSAVSGVNYIADALRRVHNHFGDDFIITMAPETYYIQAARLSSNDITTAYLRLALEIKDILTICYPQFYNSGTMFGYDGAVVSPGSADFITSLSTLIIEAGLRPDQVALGVPSTSQAAGSGYVDPSVLENAINALAYGTSSGRFTAPEAYPAIRGVMTWSINWDATNDYAWAKAMSLAMDKLPEVENGGSQTPEKPEIEESKTEESKTEESETEESETEESKTEESETEESKTEESKTEESETEESKTEESKTEESETEESKTEESKTEESETEESKTEDPVISGVPKWDSRAVYVNGDKVSYNGKIYQAMWWNQGTNPEKQGQWGPWKLIGIASDDTESDDTGNVENVPAWNSSSVYVAGDQVNYNGKIYQAMWWNQGTNPEKQGQWGPWKLVR